MTTSALSHHIFVLMGVSGSGKSVVASKVACQMKTAVLDGDYLHSRANIEKMSQGQPLDDSDRVSWLQALNDAAFAMQRTNNISLIVCSALKKCYRDQLRAGNQNLSFIYLRGDFNTIEQRLHLRKGHFFRPEMLVTQFATLEEPGSDEPDVRMVDIRHPLNKVVTATIQTIKQVVTKETLF